MKRLILALAIFGGSILVTGFKSVFAAEVANLFKCNTCDKAFTRRSNLEAHIRTHAGENLYKCDFNGCVYEAARKHDLTKHERIQHAGEKLFKCYYGRCAYKTECNDDLTKHIREMHYKKCDLCSDLFENEMQLEVHRRNHIEEQVNILGNIELTKEMSEFFQAKNLLKFGDAWKLCKTPADKIRVIEETIKVISAEDNNKRQTFLKALDILINYENLHNYIKEDLRLGVDGIRKSIELDNLRKEMLLRAERIKKRNINQQDSGGAAAVDQGNAQIEERPKKKVRSEDDSVMQNENLGFECPQCKEKFKTMLEFNAHSFNHS